GPANSDDQATALAVDGSGNVLVTGYSDAGTDTGFYDYATIKYSGAGVPLWTNRYNGPGSDDDVAKAVAGDGSGKVFVTGHSYGSGRANTYEALSHGGAVCPLWPNLYNRSGNRADYATA